MPFDGWELRGAVANVLVGGRSVYANDAVDEATSLSAVLPPTTS